MRSKQLGFTICRISSRCLFVLAHKVSTSYDITCTSDITAWFSAQLR